MRLYDWNLMNATTQTNKLILQTKTQDKTLADKLMYIPNDDAQNFPF